MISIDKVSDVLDRASALEAEGCWEEVISLLTQRNRQKENIEIEARLVKTRRKAFLAQSDNLPDKIWPKSVVDMFPSEKGVPEVQAEELTAAKLASAIQHHGSLIVRGLVKGEDAKQVSQAIDATLKSRASLSDKMSGTALPWFNPLNAPSYRGLSVDRDIFGSHDIALAVDSPRTLFRHLEALHRTSCIDIVKEYFGEQVAISARKSTIRRAPPNAPTGWHQDGIFFGRNSRSLNIWTAYSPCGVDSASLDVVALPFSELVQADGGDFNNQSVSNDRVLSYGTHNIVRPVFDIGDAIIFDHLTLHRTGIDERMTKSRDAIELWFFAASTYPDNQIPLLV